MPKYQDIASKTIMGNPSYKKEVYAIKTEKSPHKYAAELMKHTDGHYQLNLIVHGRSGKNQRDGTLNDIGEFISEVKKKFTAEEWDAFTEITFGGDVNFATVTNQQSEVAIVQENREQLQQVLYKAFSTGYDITISYPTEVTIQKRAEQSSQNSQYFKNGGTEESTSDVLVGAFIKKNENAPEKSSPVHILHGSNPIAMVSKAYEAGVSSLKEGELKSRLDHSMVFLPSQNTLNVYVNIVPARGWNGLQAPKPGLNASLVEKHYEELQAKMEAVWKNLRNELTPGDSRNIREWQYLFTTPITQEKLDKCRFQIQQCVEAIFISPEYQTIAQQLFDAIALKKEDEKNDPREEFILPIETEKEQIGAWRKLGIYVSGQSDELLQQLVARYMYNMNTSMSRLEGPEQNNPAKYSEYKSFAFNNIANDIFTALGQQMLGGYPVPEDIAQRARDAASSPNPRDGINEICNEIEAAQLAQIEQSVLHYLSQNPQFTFNEVVLHAVEIGDNIRFNADIIPHQQLSKSWVSTDLAKQRNAIIKLELNDLKQEKDAECDSGPRLI